jgi:tetratricopeptide (TPR) repeat protein
MKNRHRFPQVFACALLLSLLLSACAAPPAPLPQAAKTDQQWLNSMRSARSAFELGHYQSASRLYGQALQRGRQTDRTEDIADAAYNLAASLIQLGDYSAAGNYLQEAKSETRRLGNNLNEILLLEASLARMQADADRSRDITSQLLQQLPVTDRRLRPQALLLCGLIACEEGNSLQAQQELTTASGLLSDNHHPAIAASRTELRGCIHLLQGRPLDAAREFDRESSYLRQARQYRQMVYALHRAGTAYATAGENYQAADRQFRAARSAFGQKKLQAAQLLLDKAQTAALAADSRLLLQSIARLRAEISERKLNPK